MAASTTVADHAQQPSAWPTILMFGAIIVIFYFLAIRPQNKRAKAHREMVSNIGKGDEVVTNGGMMGKVTDVDDSSITLEIAKDVHVKHQKHAIASVLPKGSVK